MTEYKSTKIQQELFSFGERDGDRLASMGESVKTLQETFIAKNSANNSVFDSRSRDSTSIYQFYDSALTQLRFNLSYGQTEF